MKKFLSAVFILLSAHSLFAQAPEAINYQTVVRNSSGAVIANQAVKLGFLIHDGSPTGTVVYGEIDSGETNQFGLFTHLSAGVLFLVHHLLLSTGPQVINI